MSFSKKYFILVKQKEREGWISVMALKCFFYLSFFSPQNWICWILFFKKQISGKQYTFLSSPERGIYIFKMNHFLLSIISYECTFTYFESQFLTSRWFHLVNEIIISVQRFYIWWLYIYIFFLLLLLLRSRPEFQCLLDIGHGGIMKHRNKVIYIKDTY